MCELNITNNQEFKRAVEGFANENVSLDVNPHEDMSFGVREGISYSLVNDGKNKLLSISRKYATKAILPEQMEDFILDAAISIKNNKESTENVLKSLTENIKNSVKNNLVVLPVSGIVLETPFKIGIFNLYPQKTFIETTVLDLDAQRYGRGSFREILTNEMNFNQIILGNSDLWNRVNIAFEWLGKQYDEENDENKMIYSIFALECLLNSNTENFSSITAAVAKDLREKNPPPKKGG